MRNFFKEDAIPVPSGIPTNSSGAGDIAGIGIGKDGEPGVPKDTQYKKKNKISPRKFNFVSLKEFVEK